MMTFSDTFRAVLWVVLCAFMVVGMVSIAILYGATKFVFKNVAWKEVNFTFPNLKLPRLKTALN